MKLTKVFACIAVSACFSLYAQSVEEILTIHSDLDRVPDYNYSVLSIDNIEANGRTEHFECMQFGGGDNGLKNVVFDFKAPARLKGTRVLQAEKNGKDDDRWIYLPELRVSRRIPSSDKKKSFVGTEFSYGDMTLRKPGEDNSSFVNENGSFSNGSQKFDCWIIKSVPVKKSEVDYAYRISYFDKRTYVPVYVEFYDAKDNITKTHTVTKLEMVKGVTGIEYPLRRSNEIFNKVTGRKTICTVTKFKFDEEIPSSYFSQNYLISGKAK